MIEMSGEKYRLAADGVHSNVNRVYMLEPYSHLLLNHSEMYLG